METFPGAIRLQEKSNVGNQVPRYSGWKHVIEVIPFFFCDRVGNQVPRYSGWKHFLIWLRLYGVGLLETKYRDITDGNLQNCVSYHDDGMLSDTKYRDITDGNCW